MIERLQSDRDLVLLLEGDKLIETESAMREHLTELDVQEPMLAWSLNDAGLLMAMEGRLEIAQALFERALKSIEGSFGLMHPARGTLLHNLGDVLLRRRDPAAVDRYRESASVFETAAGASHPRFACVLNSWAIALASLGREEEAEVLYRRSIRIYEELETDNQRKRAIPGIGLWTDSNPLDLVAPLHNLALLLLDGGRLAESEALLRRAYWILNSNGKHMDPQVVPLLRALGKVMRAGGNVEKANVCDATAARLVLKQADSTLVTSP
jgi:tetratricopeptide (TPR) repeat protein